MSNKSLVTHIARTLSALKRCQSGKVLNANAEYSHNWRLERMAREFLPSGSGFDSGTRIDIETSTPSRIVLITDFHHMSEHGYYTGWSQHKVIVTPSLEFGFEMRVTGRDRNAIKEYIADTFDHALRSTDYDSAYMLENRVA